MFVKLVVAVAVSLFFIAFVTYLGSEARIIDAIILYFIILIAQSTEVFK